MSGTGFLQQKSAGHSADIQHPLTGQIHDISTDPGIKLVGTWSTISDVRGFEGSYSQSLTANDTITLQYFGASFWVRWRIGSDAGKAQVTVDGTIISPSGGLDLYSSVAGYAITPFGFTLTRMTHIVVITVLGTKNANSSAANVRVDMIMTDNDIGLHQVVSMSEETIPTIIGGALSFLSIMSVILSSMPLFIQALLHSLTA